MCLLVFLSRGGSFFVSLMKGTERSFGGGAPLRDVLIINKGMIHTQLSEQTFSKSTSWRCIR